MNFSHPKTHILPIFEPLMTAPFVDIHTHHPAATEQCVSVRNLDLEADVPALGYFSCGIHPWALDDEMFVSENALQIIENQLSNSNVLALGEAGLDRLHKASLERQMAVFERQIALSEQYCKPLLIHNVKCNVEIMALRKRCKPQQTWILHGFNGSLQEVEQLLDYGFCFSVGTALLHPDRKIRKSLKTIPLENLFFETDTASISVEKVYQEAAMLLEMPMDALRERIFANFARIFGDNDGRLAR